MSAGNTEAHIEVAGETERRSFLTSAFVAMAAASASTEALAFGPPKADAPAEEPKYTPNLHPVRLDSKHLEGKDLPDLGPWPAAMQPRPVKTHRLIEWYTGPKLSCMVYDADDGLLKFTDLPYDEQVVVLNGTATLTSVDGKVEVFNKGDVFVAPKGWNGTWELAGGYRELICFETSSLAWAMKAWFS